MDSYDPLQKIRKALHDLAQPLAAVTGLVDLMLLEMGDQDPILQEVQAISEQMEQVLQIVGEIRRLARDASAGERTALQPLPASGL